MNYLDDAMNNLTIWCSGCSAEPAVQTIETLWNGEWIELPLGTACLTRLEKEDKLIEE